MNILATMDLGTATIALAVAMSCIASTVLLNLAQSVKKDARLPDQITIQVGAIIIIAALLLFCYWGANAMGVAMVQSAALAVAIFVTSVCFGLFIRATLTAHEKSRSNPLRRSLWRAILMVRGKSPSRWLQNR